MISLSSKWLIAFFTGVILLIIVSPLLYGRLHLPPDKIFTYTNATNAADNLSYFSWIEQARQGHVLLQDLYTTEQQSLGIFNPLFLIMGWFGSATGLSNQIVYSLFRILAVLGLIVVAYRFTGNFISENSWRILAWILVLVGGGLDWIFPMQIDTVFIPDFMVFHNLISSLLQCVSLMVILMVFDFVISKYRNQGKRYVFYNGLLLNFLVLIHPYSFITIASVLIGFGIYQFFRTREANILHKVLWTIVLAMPSVVWVAFLLTENSAFAIWSFFQSHVPAPEWFFVLASLGVLFLGTGYFLFNFRSKINGSDNQTILIFWAIIMLVMMYNPVFPNFARRFGQGIFIPFTIMAVIALQSLYRRLASIKQGYFAARTVLVLFVILCLPTTLFIVTGEIYVASKFEYPSFISVDTAESLRWLKQNTASDDKILTGYYYGYLVPGFAGRKVFLGHYDQTVNFVQKQALVKEVWRQNIKAPRLQDPLPEFMRQNGLSYVVEDSQVKFLGQIQSHNNLKLRFRNKEIAIYQLQ